MVHYRVPFFERVHHLCANLGIDFEVLYGQPSLADVKRGDSAELKNGLQTRNRYFAVFGQELVWQSLPSHIHYADLIVMSQESRILSNYVVLLRHLFRRDTLAFWGHGRNFQSDHANGIREKWKSFILRKVGWWFTYTALSAEVMAQQGVPEERLTILNNSIDSRSFKRDLAGITSVRLAQLRREFRIGIAASVGLYCGSLNDDKRLDGLVQAYDRIQDVHTDFHLFVIGAGPNAHFLIDATKTRPGLHYVGEKRGIEKAEFFRLAQIILNPGLVGLSIVDAFSAGLPLVTMVGSRHSPEIAYLQNGVNGVISDDTVEAFAASANRLLDDWEYREKLSINARASGEHYTIENMAMNFVHGITRCLARNGKVSIILPTIASQESGGSVT